MDLSRLSNEDLLALKNGDLSKLSNEALVALKKAQAPEPGLGNARDLLSGVNRTIGSMGDALVAGYNLMLPKEHEVQPLSQGMRSAGVDLDRPRSFLGMVGEYAMPGPGGAKTQALETLLAAGGGYLARQAAPDSLLAEAGGAIAATMGGKMAPSLAAEGVRRTFRGADPTQMAANVALADSLNAPTTVGAASKTPWAMTLERLSGSVPGGVNAFRQAGKEAAEAIKSKLVKLTGGEADDIVKAGRLIQRGLFDPDSGWTKRSMDVRDKLYGKLDEKFAQRAWFQSRGVPNDYARTVAGAPESQAMWPTSWADDVAPIMRDAPRPTDARNLMTRGQEVTGGMETSPSINLPARAPIRAAGEASGFAATNTRQFIAKANKGVSGAPTLSKELFSDPQVQKFFDDFAIDLDMGNGRIPYEAIKRLRTEVGDLLGDPQLIGSSRRDLLKKFYGVLTDDMKVAAEEAGALKEFNRANAYHKARIERIEDFYDNLYKKTTPEEVWGAVIGDTPKSASRISAIRKGLTPDEWKYIRKTVVTRMGEPVASAAKEGDGINFSAGTFLTNYERMKKNGTISAIFGSGQYRKDLDTVATYASNLRESAEVLSNPSGTAGLGLTASVYYGALGMLGGAAVMAGGAAGLVGIGTGLLANNQVARLMNNQRFVHWLAQSTKIPPVQAATHLKRLPVIMGNDPNDLEDVQAFIDAVTGSAP